MKRSKPTHQIRGIDDLFGDSEVEVQGDREVSLETINTNPQQPRHYYNPKSLEQLAASIKKYGFKGSLWVRPSPTGIEGQYELIAGERRYRAAQMAGLTTVSIAIYDVSDEDAFELTLAENLLREDLNPVEETQGVVDLLCLKLKKSQDEVLTDLKAIANAQKYKAKTLDNVIQDKRAAIAEIMQPLGGWTPESFYTNRIPILNLPEDVMKIVQQGKLHYNKARAIAGIQDKAMRSTLLENAIAENLSIREIKSAIAEISQKKKNKPSKLEAQRDRIVRKLKQPLPANKVKQKQLAELFKKIQDLLEN